MYCTDMFNTGLFIIPNDENLKILQVEQQYSTTLFFNEDGSGGVWTLSDIETVSTNWNIIKALGDNTYKTLKQDTNIFISRELSQESIDIAYEHVDAKEIETIYEEYVSNNRLKISWRSANETGEIIINFILQYGD